MEQKACDGGLTGGQKVGWRGQLARREGVPFVRTRTGRGDGTAQAWRQGEARTRGRRRAARADSGKEFAWRRRRKEICLYCVVLATLERVGQRGVHTAREGALVHHAYAATCARRQGYVGA
jgi:hypothetical protein